MRREEEIKGWVGSLLFHLLAGVLLFLWQVGMTPGGPEYIEVSLGTASTQQITLPARAPLPGTDAESRASAATGRSTRDLPERRFPRADDDVLRIPESRKMDVVDVPLQSRVRVAENTRGQKDHGVGIGSGVKERFAPPGRGDLAGIVANPQGVGTAGGAAGTDVSMSMTWSDGGSRRKISGDLPEYPPGVQVEAQIRIGATVVPDGTVRNLKPAQKGNTKLEDAAMKAVRLWRFEPLRRSLPQREQECTITFNFRLR
jgi:TonB family protein